MNEKIYSREFCKETIEKKLFMTMIEKEPNWLDVIDKCLYIGVDELIENEGEVEVGDINLCLKKEGSIIVTIKYK